MTKDTLEDYRGHQKAHEQTGGWEATRWGRPAPSPCHPAPPWGISPRASRVFLHHLLGSISTLRLSRFDPRAYVQPSGLYKDPAPPSWSIKSFKIFSWRSTHLEPTLVPQSSFRLELRQVRLGLEGDQATLGFLTLARAWFDIYLVLYSISLFHLRLYRCYYVYVNIKLYITYVQESNVHCLL
jgi:hypothetical protein